MKNTIKVAAAVAASSLVLGACGAGGSGSASGDTQTIELWTAWTEGQTTQIEGDKQIALFEETTGYTVNQTNFTYDMLHEKLIASAAGGNLPDVVFGLPEYVGEFSKIGILAEMTEAWDQWPDRVDVSDSVKSAMSVDGKIIGFPYETTARAYLVHDNLLKEANVQTPTTWEDVLAIGSKVEDATGSSAYGVAGAGVRAPQELLVYLAQYDLAIAEAQDGGGYRNTWNDKPEESEKAAKVFKFYQDLMSSGAANRNSPTYGWEQTDENFATGLTATYVTGNWMAERELTNVEAMSDVSVHPIPYPKDGKPATYIEAKPMMVMANSDVLEGSIALAQAFASKPWQQAAYADRSALSSVSSDTKWSKDFSALLETGVTYPPISLGGVTQDMIDALARALQENQDPAAVASWLSDEINASLEKSGDLAAN